MRRLTPVSVVPKTPRRVFQLEPKSFFVMKANPRWSGGLGSLDRGEYLLIRQHQFPDEYHADDVMTGADHDRCFQWDYDNARAACTNHMGTGELGMERWVTTATPQAVIAFFQDILQTKEGGWTGFRLMGTVNRSNGYPVFTMALFRKVNPKTKVYTGEDAPNVNNLEHEHYDSITGLPYRRDSWSRHSLRHG